MIKFLKIFCFLMALFLIGFISASPLFYKIYGEYNDGKVQIKSVEVVFSQENLQENFGDYTFEVFDSESNILKTGNFYIPNVLWYDEGDEKTGVLNKGGNISLKEVSFETYVPYYDNAKKIVFYDSYKDKLTEESVEVYSRADLKDSSDETIKINGKNYEKRAPILDQKSWFDRFWWVLAVILVVVLVILIWFFINPVKQKKKK
jgi:hypothetical protein